MGPHRQGDVPIPACPISHFILIQTHFFKVRRIGGLKSSLLSGEGLVVDLIGPGKVILQTRSEDAFLSWLIPKLPQQRRSD